MWQHMQRRGASGRHLHEGPSLAQAVGLLQQLGLPCMHLFAQQVLHDSNAVLQLRHVDLRKRSNGQDADQGYLVPVAHSGKEPALRWTSR